MTTVRDRSESERLSTRQLLDRWRSEAIAAGTAEPEDFDACSPAGTDQLAELERRLGRALPPSYREFLSLTNGWPPTGSSTIGLRSTSDVGWFRDVEREWYEIWRDIDGPENPIGSSVELMARALVVSQPGDEALLLDPTEVEAGTGEWACYTFSNWAPGETAVGGSFRTGLDHVYRWFRDRIDEAAQRP